MEEFSERGLAGAVPLGGAETEALASYTADVFDYYLGRPHLARLLYWEGLERGAMAVPGESERHGRYQNKVAAVSVALGHASDATDEAAHLLLTLIVLASSWHVLPQLNRMILDHDSPDARRGEIIRMVELMAGRPHSPA